MALTDRAEIRRAVSSKSTSPETIDSYSSMRVEGFREGCRLDNIRQSAMIIDSVEIVDLGSSTMATSSFAKKSRQINFSFDSLVDNFRSELPEQNGTLRYTEGHKRFKKWQKRGPYDFAMLGPC